MVYTHLAAALVAAVLSAGAAWQVQSWRFDAREKQRIEQQARETERLNQQANAAGKIHEKKRQANEIRYVTKIQEVERVVERPVYRNVCLDAVGLRLLHAQIDRADTARAGRELPEAGAPDGD